MAETATQAVRTPASGDATVPDEAKKQGASAFFVETIATIPPNFAELLEKYSGIPPSEQTAHMVSLRDEAYKAHHYPCLGLFRFTMLALSAHPLYRSYVLPTLLAPSPDPADAPIFLDLGTCLGQDVRKLVHDGVAPSRLYGADLLPAFIDLGYELFRDRAHFPAPHFLAPADVFDASPTNALSALDGQVSILQTNSFFHLFAYADQLTVAKRVVRLLRPAGRGAAQPQRLILGSQNANVNPAEYPSRSGHRDKTMFRHNEASWAAFWARVSDDLDGRVTFEVESKLSEPRLPRGEKAAATWRGEGYRWMIWSVWVKFA